MKYQNIYHKEETKINVLVTGVAGFIGYHTARALLNHGITVHGIDHLNAYYDVQLKHDRLKQLQPYDQFYFYPIGLDQRDAIQQIVEIQQITHIIHLAAQAGVRYSLTNPDSYIESNITGFLNILEVCRATDVKHLIYASSSSVYGANVKTPFSTDDAVDHPVSLYAATKKANELMAHTYSHLYNIPTTGLRFFTVYGPWGRPDMAYFKFCDAIMNDQPIQLYNHGKMLRDFTYIDDIVDAIIPLIDLAPTLQTSRIGQQLTPSTSHAPYRIYNIGNNQPEQLVTLIQYLDNLLGKKAIKQYVTMQPGDVEKTYADIEDLERAIGFKPKTNLYTGLRQFVEWYMNYYVKKNL